MHSYFLQMGQKYACLRWKTMLLTSNSTSTKRLFYPKVLRNFAYSEHFFILSLSPELNF
jgi:hypothetical protein